MTKNITSNERRTDRIIGLVRETDSLDVIIENREMITETLFRREHLIKCIFDDVERSIFDLRETKILIINEARCHRAGLQEMNPKFL